MSAFEKKTNVKRCRIKTFQWNYREFLQTHSILLYYFLFYESFTAGSATAQNFFSAKQDTCNEKT